MVPLPGGGFGSSTEAAYLASNMTKDKAWADFKAGRIGSKEMERITGYKSGSRPSAGGWKPPTEGSSTPTTRPPKPGDIKLGPGGLPPEFRNQGNTAIPADFKPGVIMPTETERQEMENNPNFINGLPPGMNPAGTPSAAWNAPQSPQQPNSRPISGSGTAFVDDKGNKPPIKPGSGIGKPGPMPPYMGGDALYFDDKGNKPNRPQAGGSEWQNGTVGPTNTAWTGYGNPPRPVPMPPWGGGDNPYTPEIEPPRNKPPMLQPGIVEAGFSATSVTPEFNYTDPKKFKKEMLNLKQDIREAQADGDTEKLNRLIDKQNKANYTVQGLNAGLSQEEAARYAKREADIDAKAKAKGGAGGRIEEPGTVERRQQDKPRNQEARQNTLDRAEAQRLANGTPEEQAKYDKLKRAGQLPGQDGKPITPIADPVDRGGKTRKPIADPVDRGGGSQQPTAQSMFQDIDARNRANEQAQQAAQSREAQRNQAARDAVAQKHGYANAEEAAKNGMQIGNPGGKPPGGSGGGGGGGGGGGRGGGKGKGKGAPQGRETAKERNARMEAAADKRRDAQYKADRRQDAINEGYSRLDPEGSKKFFERARDKKEANNQKQGNNPRPSSKPSNSSGNVHHSKASGGKGWQGYADDWTAEANRLRKAGDLKGAAEAEKAAKQYSSYKEGDNPYASIPKLSDKNKPSSPANTGEVSNDNSLNLGMPDTSSVPDITYTPGSPNTTGNPLSSNNTGFNNGGGMGGGQGGGGGGGNSGSGGRFVTINGQVRYFA